jgi:hypothetical protein
MDSRSATVTFTRAIWGSPLFCSIKIDGKGKATNMVEALERDILIDEFGFKIKGSAWLTTQRINTLAVVKPSGRVVTVTIVGGLIS